MSDTTPNTPAPNTPAVAPAGPPAAPATPPADEAAALKSEALKSARELREAREQLQRYQRAEREAKAREAMTAKEREEEQRLLEVDPHAWLEKRAGMPRTELHRRLSGAKDTPESAQARRLEELASKTAELEKSLKEREEAAQRSEAEREQATAYRSVLGVAKAGEADPELRMAARRISEMGPAAGREIATWVAQQWPKVAAETGADPGDLAEAHKTAAKMIGQRALAEVRKLWEDPVIRAALVPADQSQRPPASQASPARTITSEIAGSRGTSAAPDKPLSRSERDAELRRHAERVVSERLAARG